MKRFTAVLFVLLLAVPMFAREARPKLKRVAAGTVTVERKAHTRADVLRILRQAREAAAPKRDVGAQAIIVNRSARALVIPVAGSAAGANGTYFRSDVTFANWNDTDQVVGILWLPNGNPAGMGVFVMAIPAESIFTEEDFVAGFLEETGVGTVILLPLDDEGEEFDDNAAIDVFSRIWTPQPNATGTVSQPFPGVEPEYMTNEEEGVILGMRQDAQYRTNFGIVNISPDPLTFEVAALAEGAPSNSQTVTVPSLSMIQQSLAGGAFGQVSLGVTVTNPPQGEDAEFTWLAYASSVDNITGDGWVSLVANPWNDARLDETESGQ